MKPLNQLYRDDRPREKLVRKGAGALKGYELAALMLGSGTRHKDVLALAREVAELLEARFEEVTLEELTRIHGLGRAKAAQILAAIELCRRHLVQERVKIASADDVYRQLREYAQKQQEYLVAMTLDGGSHLIETRVVTIGTLNQSLVHPREVFADAVADRAAGIIVAHNHPSGVLEPSAEDRRVTLRLREAGEIMGIELLDHVILARGGYLSLRETGLL